MSNLIERINKGLSDRIETVMSTHFPNAKKQANSWRMGDLDGAEGGSAGVFRGRGGIYIATDNATGESLNIMQLYHRKLGVSWKEALAEAKKLCGIREVQSVKKQQVPKVKPFNGQIRATDALKYLNSRGIKEDTCAKYHVKEIAGKDLPPSNLPTQDKYIAFPFTTPDGEGAMYKWLGLERPKGKKDTRTTFPQYATLFGWRETDNNTREIIITEGEIDCLSVAQLKPQIPVLSVPCGVSNLNWIDNDYEKLETLETIYLLMDMDDAGEKAAQTIAKRLGLTRCRRIRLPEGYKDANEFLLSKEHGKPTIQQLLDEAKTYDPAQLRGASEMSTGLSEEIERFTREQESNNFLWPELPFRIRQGEMTVVTGFPGHGKSQYLYQMLLHEMLVNNRRVCIASYEIPAKNMLFNMLWMHYGHSPKIDDYKEKLKLFEDKLWFIEGEEGSQSWEMLKEDFLYAAKRFGCEIFVIDALLHITRKGDAEGTDLVAKQTAKFCVDNDLSLMLVCHADAKKRRSGDDIPETEDILGGQGIGAAAHNVMSVWRNRAKEKALAEGGLCDDPDGKIYVCKQRSSGNLILKDVWFNRGRRTFHLTEDEAAHNVAPRQREAALSTRQEMASGDYIDDEPPF